MKRIQKEEDIQTMRAAELRKGMLIAEGLIFDIDNDTDDDGVQRIDVILMDKGWISLDPSYEIDVYGRVGNMLVEKVLARETKKVEERN